MVSALLRLHRNCLDGHDCVLLRLLQLCAVVYRDLLLILHHGHRHASPLHVLEDHQEDQVHQISRSRSRLGEANC